MERLRNYDYRVKWFPFNSLEAAKEYAEKKDEDTIEVYDVWNGEFVKSYSRSKNGWLED